jgi:hypothetical protein|tara:strand:- start:168 stop:722 length:555 start_codon:yes stop_codon:yes gene_type:complete
MSVWKTLSSINVNDHTEKKGNLTYLSWAWAWAVTKDHYPDSNYFFRESEIHSDGTMTVHCDVTIDGLSHEMWLPVLDHRNKPIPNPNAFQINTSKMRCLTKGLAMHGLGAYIYAGEDLPAPEPAIVITPPEIKVIEDLIAKTDTDKQVFCDWLSVSDTSDIMSNQYAKAVSALEKKWEQMNEGI